MSASEPNGEPAAMDAITQRIDRLTAWLSENAPYCGADQAHLDEDTPERAYWHYGYLVALRDVQRLLVEDVAGLTGPA
jgi:hypothetical protein